MVNEIRRRCAYSRIINVFLVERGLKFKKKNRKGKSKVAILFANFLVCWALSLTSL